MSMEETLDQLWAEAIDAEGDLDLDVLSVQIDAQCWSAHREEYVAWMRAQSVAYQRLQLREISRVCRKDARRTVTSRRFLRTVNELADRGARSAEEIVEAWRLTIADGLQRPIMDLTGGPKGDHACVAAGYAKTARSAALEEAFHRHLAKVVPAGKPTHAKLSADDVLALYRRVVGEHAEPRALAA